MIKMAECFKDLQNYHLLTAVISGLNNSATLRWEFPANFPWNFLEFYVQKTEKNKK